MPKCPFCDHRNPPSAVSCEQCKAPLSPAGQTDDRSLEEQLRSLLDNGEKVEAIALYRERTGAGLREASDAVDAFRRGEPLPSLPQIDNDLEDEILPLLKAGNKIQAVKAYRKRTGSNLKDAARAIDALAAQHGLATKGSGCAGASVLILIAVCTAILVFL